jgi:alginate O-acetyltransferase complex protein AlgI
MQMLFFPMLFMGPISRVEDFEEEYWNYTDVLRRLAIGLSMLVIGHLCGNLVLDEVRHVERIPVQTFWVSAAANSFQFYFTFAGYTHLIIGLALLVGFKLPENFNNPYLATSITDFWRRWHMSLSYWIRDYVYVPLGGNRKGIARKCANMLIAMSLFGIWHGLTLNFLAWGVYHGVLLSIESLTAHYRIAPLSILPASLARSVRVALTFALVTLGWILFKYPISDSLVFLRRMVAW